jgi:hypothetical protein
MLMWRLVRRCLAPVGMLCLAIIALGQAWAMAVNLLVSCILFLLAIAFLAPVRSRPCREERHDD